MDGEGVGPYTEAGLPAGSVPLFDGEFVIADDGIYTAVHEYRHSSTGRTVHLVGMNHDGDSAYYAAVDDLLSQCDIVCYEAILPDTRPQEARDQELAGLYDAAFGQDVEEAFLPSVQLFFRRAESLLASTHGTVGEGETFDYSREDWYNVDLQDGDVDPEELAARVEEALSALPAPRKEEVVAYMRKRIDGIDAGAFSPRELGDAFVFLYRDPQLSDAVKKAFGDLRDEIAFTRFDELVERTDASTIGIKFGAAHLPHQQELLEERGYVEADSYYLRNMAF